MYRLADHVALLVATGSVVGWWAVLTVVNPHCIADERIHYGIIAEILARQPLSTHLIPMLPVYHYLVAAPLMLLGNSLAAARAVNVAITLAGLCLIYACTADRTRPQRSLQILLLAWNPILMPLSALVYTDSASVVALLAAALAAGRGRYGWSAAAAAAACLLRQSNVVWVACLAAWCVVRAYEAEGSFLTLFRSRHRLVQGCKAAWPYALVLAGAAGLLAYFGGPTVGPAYDNRPRLNPAQFFLFGCVVGTVWLPVWVAEASRQWDARILRGLRWGAACAALVGAAGILGMLYSNPHPWNGDPAYLRNRLLVGLHTSLALRASVSLALASLVPLILWFTAAQPRRVLLGLTWAFGLLYLAPHWLAEMRYHLLPIVLLHLWTHYPPRLGWALLAWNALLSVAICAFVAAYGSTHGGLW